MDVLAVPDLRKSMKEKPTLVIDDLADVLA
jgi:hypothetical protein